MKRNKITISDGIVTIPRNPQMTDFEIAELFEVFTQMVRANIKTILKAEICIGNYENGGTVFGSTVVPDFFGLDMIMALAFRVQSKSAEQFRNYVLRKLQSKSQEPLYLQIPTNTRPN